MIGPELTPTHLESMHQQIGEHGRPLPEIITIRHNTSEDIVHLSSQTLFQDGDGTTGFMLWCYLGSDGYLYTTVNQQAYTTTQFAKMRPDLFFIQAEPGTVTGSLYYRRLAA